jgi:tetratricopeptide (TPR) repeat protein
MKRASEFADDLIQKEGAGSELRLRVAARGLAACVGLQGKVDPAAWADQAIRAGKELTEGAASDSQKRQSLRELGVALYDAVQVCQMRKDHDGVQKYGKQAIECLEAVKPSKDRPADVYLLGRLYFRMGAVRASGEPDHRAAVAWFDKAVATLQQVVSQAAPAEQGRLGETFVTMGVSYWETGQRERALQVTQQGVEMMEKAVIDGSLPKTILEVPYKNLATMHRQLGQEDKARRYAEKANFRADTIRE